MYLTPKLVRRLIGCVYFVAAVIVYGIQVMINVLYAGFSASLPPNYFSSGGNIFWSRTADMILFFLAILFFILGIYYTFFSKLGDSGGKPS